MGPAQQDVVILALIVRQRECRILEKLKITFDETRLAAPALPLLAAVHQRNPLAEGSVEDDFALLNFHFHAKRLEANGMNCWCRHGLLGLIQFLMRVVFGPLVVLGAAKAAPRTDRVS